MSYHCTRLAQDSVLLPDVTNHLKQEDAPMEQMLSYFGITKRWLPQSLKYKMIH